LKNALSSTEGLHTFLKGMLGQKRINDTKIPFFAILEHGGQIVPYSDLGRLTLADVITGSAVIPGIFEPWNIENLGSVSTGAAVNTYPLADIRQALDATTLIVVDVLSGLGKRPASGDLTGRYRNFFVSVKANFNLIGADLVVRPDLNGFAFDDFSKQSEITMRGRDKMDEMLPQLQSILGKNAEPAAGAPGENAK
jgi:NTE family protein